MKKAIFHLLLFFNTAIFSQIDYSDSWQDFYSYNNVKDFIKVDNIIYALSDNAVFTYNENTTEIKKFSSIQGLSGETTSALYYSESYDRLVIGYENGLVEVIDGNGSITISSDIVNFSQSGNKRINHISEFENILYLSTPFAIIEYDIEKLEFGDTFFIGNGSTSLNINQTLISDNKIYAATEDGIFKADVTSNLLVDFNIWEQQFENRNFGYITFFENQIYLAENSSLFLFENEALNQIRQFSESIYGLKSSLNNLSVALSNSAIVLDSNHNEIVKVENTPDFDFTLSNSLFTDNFIYLSTKEFGILKSSITEINNFEEIHPEGPFTNDVFSIAAHNNSLWIVYGGYSSTYAANQNEQGYTHYTGEEWVNIKFNPDTPFSDLNHISIDKNAENRVFISSFGTTTNVDGFGTGGLLEVENNEFKTFFNHTNSTIENTSSDPARVTIRVTGTTFDKRGNLWLANVAASNELKKMSESGQWASVDLSELTSNKIAIGLTEVISDNSNSIWIGTRRNGVYIYNENGNRKKVLIANPNVGNLPDLNVRTITADGSNRIWIGTKLGMVVYRNGSNVFDDDTPNAQPVIIEENGVGERLLGDQTINSIVVDGADNKWFGTDNGGVLYTNPSGQTTLANFSKANSPLPSNRILKISVDNNNGKVYFATDKGIVAYNSNVAPFGDVLAEVYAYPNPALKSHETITIDGRNGSHLPKGTNVKILDVSGHLVFETNVVEGQELQGGKVVWDKTNLAGNKVASGVYIVLLTNEDSSETATAKIAIVN